MAGVIVFDMLYIPPQPKKVANWVICELEHPQVYVYNFTPLYTSCTIMSNCIQCAQL